MTFELEKLTPAKKPNTKNIIRQCDSDHIFRVGLGQGSAHLFCKHSRFCSLSVQTTQHCQCSTEITADTTGGPGYVPISFTDKTRWQQDLANGPQFANPQYKGFGKTSERKTYLIWALKKEKQARRKIQGREKTQGDKEYVERLRYERIWNANITASVAGSPDTREVGKNGRK